MGKYVGKNALTAFWNGIKAMFSDVAFSGDADDVSYDNTDSGLSATNVQNALDELSDEKADSSSLATVATTGSYNSLSNKPSLATVATSGSYDDLSNRPTIGVSNVDFNSLTKTGLYYVETPTANVPDAQFTIWDLTVIASSGGGVVKQIAVSAGDYNFTYERHRTGGTWKDWVGTNQTIQYIGNYSETAGSFRKRGAAGYGSFIMVGTAGGVGGFCLMGIINNNALGSVINLATGASWSNANLTLSYSVTNSIGYLRVTTGSGGSRITVLWG